MATADASAVSSRLASSGGVLRFGRFEVDVRAGDLRKNGLKIKLADQPFRVLAALLASPGQVVTREQLRCRVWPEDTFVDFDHGLNLAITKIRAVLDDDPNNPRFIVTVPRRGYKFLAPVTAQDSDLIWPHTRAGLLVFAITGGVLVLALLIYLRFFNPRPHSTLDKFEVRQITHSGKETVAAVSPDGRYVVSALEDSGLQSLWLHNVPTGSDAQVGSPAPAFYRSLAFSPDGNYVYFRRAERHLGMLYSLYRIPVLGGRPQFVKFDVDSEIAFSPDAQHIAYVRANDPEMGKYRLLTATADGKEESVLYIAPIVAFFPQSLAWSPDGKLLAYSVLQPGDALSAILLFDITTGHISTLAKFADKRSAELRWSPDGRGLVMLYHARGPYLLNGQIGFVSYPEGLFRPITRDTNNYESLTVSADGLRITAVQARSRTSISFINTGKSDVSIPALDIGDSTWFDLTLPGELLISDLDKIVLKTPSGSSSTIVSDAGAFLDTPADCAGQYFVFTWQFHDYSSDTNIWRVNRDGSGAVKLTSGKWDTNPACSPDGHWIYYREADTQEILRTSASGGAAERIPRRVGPLVIVGPVAVSPDGDTLAYSALIGDPDQKVNEQRVVLINSDPKSQSAPRFLNADSRMAGPVTFTNDGRAVAYPIRINGIDNIWIQPLNGSPGQQLTHFQSQRIAVIHSSRDGQSLAISRYATESDVVMMEQAKSE